MARRQLVRREQMENKNGALRDATFQLLAPRATGNERTKKKNERKEVKLKTSLSDSELRSWLWIRNLPPPVFNFSVFCLSSVCWFEPTNRSCVRRCVEKRV